MNKHILLFLREMFTSLFLKLNDEKVAEIFMKITIEKKLYQLRNALKYIYNYFIKEFSSTNTNFDNFHFILDYF
jgi:hypothetical protein